MALATLAHTMGFAVTVVDARDVFATAATTPRSSSSGRIASARSSARARRCVVLSHDPKFDVPLLRVALASTAGYVGAMGSRSTHEDRLRRLARAGVSEAQIARLRSPIGLDLGGRTPEETALSILAETSPMPRTMRPAAASELSGPRCTLRSVTVPRSDGAEACRRVRRRARRGRGIALWWT